MKDQVWGRKCGSFGHVKFDIFIRYPTGHIKQIVECLGVMFWGEVFLSHRIG